MYTNILSSLFQNFTRISSNTILHRWQSSPFPEGFPNGDVSMIFQVFWFSGTFCAMKLQNWTGLTLLDVSIETFSFHFQTDRNLSFHFQNSADNVYLIIQFCVVVQPWSCVQLFATPWTAARQDFLSFTISRSLPKLMSIALMMPSNHLILFHFLLLLPSVFPGIRVFFKESTLHQVAKVMELQIQHQFFQWIFRVDFL